MNVDDLPLPELMEEVKKRYPLGTTVKPLQSTERRFARRLPPVTIGVNKESTSVNNPFYYSGNHILCLYPDRLAGFYLVKRTPGLPTQWAEIIDPETEIRFSILDIKDAFDNAGVGRLAMEKVIEEIQKNGD